MENDPQQKFSPDKPEYIELEEPFRIIDKDGRRGWHTTSVRRKLKIPVDTNKMLQGTVTLWILPLEELSFRYPCTDRRGAHPGTDFNNHIFIGDCPDLENVHDSCFA